MAMEIPNDPVENQTRDLSVCCAAPQPTASPRILHLQGRGSVAGGGLAHTPTWTWANAPMMLWLQGTDAGFDVFNLFSSYHVTKTSIEERNEEILSTHYSTGNFRGNLFCTRFRTLAASICVL
jgi:hypothetical protein